MKHKLRIVGGATEQGIPVGNVYDKYNSRNLLVRAIMNNFTTALTQLVDRAAPTNIHEIGCGEGYWVLRWIRQGLDARGSDMSRQAIELAQANAVAAGLAADAIFSVRSVYDLNASDAADLVVCCEVLEHLDDPGIALERLHAVTGRHLLLSVPREPLWRVLNMLRGKYWAHGGNTPGHMQHWNTPDFLDLLRDRFAIVEVRTPLPWTMALVRPL